LLDKSLGNSSLSLSKRNNLKSFREALLLCKTNQLWNRISTGRKDKYDWSNVWRVLVRSKQVEWWRFNELLSDFLLHEFSDASNQLLLLNGLDNHNFLERRESVVVLRRQWHLSRLFWFINLLPNCCIGWIAERLRDVLESWVTLFQG